MGNKQTKSSVEDFSSVDGVYKHNKEHLHQQISLNLNRSLSKRSFPSFASVSSCQSSKSNNSAVSRPWSRVSRRRWKEKTLTLPYESSKTAWPVAQIESCFLPEFPVTGIQSAKNFEILEEISKGAFGKVYKVKDLVDDHQFYALKVLSKSKIIKENSVQQVKDEVQIQKLCGHHPFIVDTTHRWQNKKRLFIVSNFISGGELYDIIKTYITLPLVLIQIYVAQIAFAIDFLHGAGVIHRDLKPENILLDDDGNIQLIDFGLAKWLAHGSTTRTICGSLRYMAPEVLRGEPYGHAADWWSLGIIACLMLTSKFPTSTLDGQQHFPEGDELMKRPVKIFLPDNVELEMPPRDLLLRLLEINSSTRMQSLRKLETIPFYKGFKFKDIKDKMVRPKDLFPEAQNIDIKDESQDFNNFDENFMDTDN